MQNDSKQKINNNIDNFISYSDDGKGKWQSWTANFSFESGYNKIGFIEWGENKEEARENLIKAIQPFISVLSEKTQQQALVREIELLRQMRDLELEKMRENNLYVLKKLDTALAELAVFKELEITNKEEV